MWAGQSGLALELVKLQTMKDDANLRRKRMMADFFFRDDVLFVARVASQIAFTG